MKRFLCFFAIFVFIVKEPFGLYLILGNYYKLIYGILFLVVLGFLSRIRRQDMNKYISTYLYLFFLIVIVALLSSIISMGSDLVALFQFISSVLLFFIIYILVIKIDDIKIILNSLNAFALLISFCCLLTFFLLAHQITIFPTIKLFLPNAPDGVEFLFPLSFLHNGFSEGLKNYRSYGYFTEPAGLAFFITPYIFYNFLHYKAFNNKKYLVYSLLMILILLSTLSVAGVGAFILSSFIYLVLFSNKRTQLAYLLVGLIIALYFGSDLILLQDNQIYARRLMAISNRFIEWEAFFVRINEEIFGYGIGSQFDPVYIYDVVSNTVKDISGATNILRFVQDFGFPFFVPLIFLFLYVASIIRHLMSFREMLVARVLLMQLISSAIFFVSINLVFSPIFLLYLVLSVRFVTTQSVIPPQINKGKK